MELLDSHRPDVAAPVDSAPAEAVLQPICADEDAITLASLGYKTALKRYFGRATSIVCGVTMLTPLCGGISGLVTALSYGGPAIAVWGWCVPRTPPRPCWPRPAAHAHVQSHRVASTKSSPWPACVRASPNSNLATLQVRRRVLHRLRCAGNGGGACSQAPPVCSHAGASRVRRGWRRKRSCKTRASWPGGCLSVSVAVC